MATRYPRIQVTKDPELGAALSKAAPHLGHPRAARLVRELAIRGAEQVLAEQADRRRSRDYLKHVSRERTGLDWGALGELDALWGADPR